MFSPVNGFHNVWNFSKMLAGVGAQKPATPATPVHPKEPAGPAKPQQPVDAYKPSHAERVNQLRTQLADNPSAQKALQHLDTGGRLNRQGVMGQLERLQGNPELLGQTVKDLAHPGAMRQGADNKFCAQTDALSHMARQDPAGYAKMMADLSTKGSAQVKSGVTLNAQTDLDPSKMGSMSATQKLAAPALAEYANGAGMNVDSRGVSHATDSRKTHRTVDGTYSTGMEKMQQALVGHDWDSQYIKDGKKNHAASVDSAVQTIHDNIKKGEDPSVSRNGHWFNVTGFRATPDGGRMTVTDPLTGESKTVNAKHFLDKSEAITFDKTDLKQKGGGAVPQAAMMAQPKNEDPGGGGKAGAGSNPVED
ncbi:MAG TPA: hypothetical protein VFA20_03710 [Myxococcaceae bacterium]|nr:hypothetical protein [Myxococcaceae bacterium]